MIFKVKKFLIILLSLICLIFTSLIVYKLYQKNIASKVLDNIIIEYGKNITLDDIVKDNIIAEKISIEPELDTITSIGKHKIKVTIDNKVEYKQIEIKDTTPPTLEVKNISIYIDEDMPTINEFIVHLNDLSEVTLKDIKVEKKLGIQNIKIVASDKYHNATTKEAQLEIKEDKEPPIFSGLNPLNIYQGETPNLKNNVEAFDDRFGSVPFTIDDSAVNYDKPGTYDIIYEASDKLGNSTSTKRTIVINYKDITYMINNFKTYSQFPNYPNGCESIALYNLLKYYQINVTPNEIVDKLKKGSGPHFENNIFYGGNPEIEFVGDPRSYNGYGVFQKPIIDVANIYKPGIIDYTGHSLDEVLEIVKKNTPVQVWVSIYLQDTTVSSSWIYKPTGERINWLQNLHSMVIIGFNSNYIYVSDPYTGSTEKYSRTQFEKIYNLFGKRAIYYEN